MKVCFVVLKSILFILSVTNQKCLIRNLYQTKIINLGKRMSKIFASLVLVTAHLRKIFYIKTLKINRWDSMTIYIKSKIIKSENVKDVTNLFKFHKLK